ncbi:hypothetical protein V8E54_000705 [Elaphomyces granulatus]
MSKRSLDESPSPHSSKSIQPVTTAESTNSSNDGAGLRPILELLSPAEEQDQHGGHVKKPRNFIATVACENCRLKKTRCDESRPKCGLCKSLGLDCVYSERKLSNLFRKDQSLSMIMSTLHRLETKLENLPSAISGNIQPITGHVLQALETLKEREVAPSVRTSPHTISQTTTPSMTGQTESDLRGHQDLPDTRGQVPISFSQHGVILWPGARVILPERLLVAHERLGKNYVVDIEMSRPALRMDIHPFPLHAGGLWLKVLPLPVIQDLSNAFFATFNPFTPIMDKHFFFSLTLGAAIDSEYAYTIESCIVLNVLALGCLAVQAHEEGNFPLPGSASHQFDSPKWMDIIGEEPPGLRFFNEARKRIGFLMCGNDLQSCQYYLLSAMYFTQILRPMDSWVMVSRAAACCLSMLTNREVSFNEWEGDMKSRVFWNCVMYETIIAQELDLPASGLMQLEDYVPIPKFIPFSVVSSSSSGIVPVEEQDDSFFQYHFLAQVAHRIILTRIRHTLYFFSESGTFPHPVITTELHHQVEQWRMNLPPAIQFSAHIKMRQGSTPLSAGSPPFPADLRYSTSPAAAVAEAMLRGRFMIAKFHIGRPYLYKALRTPMALTQDDLEQVRSGLKNAIDWPIVKGIFSQMKSCIPIKFAFCSQFFGQILLLYCFSHSTNHHLRELLPFGWERWYDEMIRFLEDCAPYSPAVAKDLELLRLL